LTAYRTQHFSIGLLDIIPPVNTSFKSCKRKWESHKEDSILSRVENNFSWAERHFYQAEGMSTRPKSKACISGLGLPVGRFLKPFMDKNRKVD